MRKLNVAQNVVNISTSKSCYNSINIKRYNLVQKSFKSGKGCQAQTSKIKGDSCVSGPIIFHILVLVLRFLSSASIQLITNVDHTCKYCINFVLLKVLHLKAFRSKTAIDIQLVYDILQF